MAPTKYSLYIKNRINHILEINKSNDLNKEFPTVRNINKLKSSIKKIQETREKLLKKLKWAESKNLDDSEIITIEYSKIKDNVTVKDLK
jgi:hypothetical protein